MSSLANVLDDLTVEGELYENSKITPCAAFACGHRCLIREGKRGIVECDLMRRVLRVPFDYVAALQVDPIEKKPLFPHVMPGANALTFGMLGCDYHCSYCQNWFTSQAMRPRFGCVGSNW